MRWTATTAAFCPLLAPAPSSLAWSTLSSLASSSASSSTAHSFGSSSSGDSGDHMFFTYALGDGAAKRQLYVPLNSRSTTVSLPSTRGPNFVLPPDAVAALCRVREAEESGGVANHDEFGDDGRRPSASELLTEVRQALQSPDQEFSHVVFAGEGEPLLRLHALVAMARQIKKEDNDAAVSIRVNTNGLVGAGGAAACATFLRDAGVDSVSVALMTGDPDQYVALMEPVAAVGECGSGGAPLGAHSRVCDFIAASAALDDFNVEVTAVDRPGVDHAATEELAARLLGSSRSEAERGGGRPSVRWRPYFP
jgi:pyruvate-formate lyase-activating enzyme